MQIELFNTKKFIDVNELKEVTNLILFEKGNIPTSNGLLSTDIFGVSAKDRKESFAYISLYGHFLHPFIFKLLKRIDRKFESIVYGNIKYKITEGGLIEDENGDSGLEYLYKNWDKIKFSRNRSMMRDERVSVLESYNKDVIFTQYWIVLPAFYRDVNLQFAAQGRVSHHEINDKYSKLIRLVSMINNTNNFDFVLNSTRAKIQETLLDIYNLPKSMLEKKSGLIRKSLLGKSVDYGVRSVISAPVFKANKPSEMKIDFYHAGIPLSQCCSALTPFVKAWVKRFFQRELESIYMKYPVKLKSGEIIYVKLKNPELHFNEEYIEKQINKFIGSYGDRFNKILLPVDDPKYNKNIYLSFIGREYVKGVPESESPLIQRPATWCDILYQACYEIASDKHIYITRYPVLDYFGTFPNRIHVLSTHKTIPMFIGTKVYENYPNIDINMPKEKVSVAFADTVTMSNLYLTGLGGDFIHRGLPMLETA